ncbi:MAG: putative sensor domain DACNV-containing protein [Vicinamibacterales bacterium]
MTPRPDWDETSDLRVVDGIPSGVLAYPSDLTARVLDRWRQCWSAGQIQLPLPKATDLEMILSVCYQATLLREEGRPVTFRLSLSEPGVFDHAAGPPSGLHRLVFARPLPFDQHELRRLAPAVSFSRSLIGTTPAGQGIWGIIHSGPQWLQSVRGGRAIEQTVPDVPIVAATGPGRLLVSVGPVVLAELRDGRLSGGEMDVFTTGWMRQRLAAANLVDGPDLPATRPAVHGSGAEPDEGFGSVLAGHVLRRMLATVRAAQHGGTVILIPHARVPQFLSNGTYVQVKYAFDDEEPRTRIRTLMKAIAQELTAADDASAVDWHAYETSRAPSLVALDEALFEVAHLVADFTRVDGAVLLTDSLEVLGFGAEIAGELPKVSRVMRAHDPDGASRTWVRTDRVGTRHRSAYRLCQAVRDALVLVVSQDGAMRFIRWHEGCVAYWEQVATGPWEG